MDITAGGVTGGAGRPLILLHGFPEMHIAWRKVARIPERDHTLINPDPGYGASRRDAMVPRWTKRRVGEALIALMRTLDYEHFAFAEHDRGARAGGSRPRTCFSKYGGDIVECQRHLPTGDRPSIGPAPLDRFAMDTF